MPEDTKPTMEEAQSRLALKKKVRMFYDLQRLRMQAAGRTQPKKEGHNDVILHERDQAILDRRAKELHNAEKDALKDVQAHLKTMPEWTKMLKAYKGIGPTIAGVILSEFDIHRHEMVSQMWSFAGLAPVPCVRCKHCQTVISSPGATHPPFSSCPWQNKKIPVSELFDSGKAMHPVKGEKLPYNKFLKTKLVGVLGPGLLKCNSPYRKFYDDYKHRWTSMGRGRSDAHRHQAAIRYMVKMLIADLYVEWRTLKGLPVREPYQSEYLGHEHHKAV